MRSGSALRVMFFTSAVYTNFVRTATVRDSLDGSGEDADDGQEAAALRAFFTIAEEDIAAAGGAEIADKDVGGAEACAEELGAIGFAEIEENVFGQGLVAGGHHVEPLDGIGFVAGTEFVEPVGGFGEL